MAADPMMLNGRVAASQTVITTRRGERGEEGKVPSATGFVRRLIDSSPLAAAVNGLVLVVGLCACQRFDTRDRSLRDGRRSAGFLCGRAVRRGSCFVRSVFFSIDC